MDNLRALTTFVRIAALGNFSKAARELGITPQAVSGHVKQLEQWVGVRLFNRTTRKISLTEEGASFYQTCATAVDALEHEVQRLRDTSEEVFGTVRVAAPYGFAWRFVAPAIGRFLELYPRVAVELMVQNQIPDLVMEGIDVGILADPLPHSSMVARKFATMRLMLCAAPAYLKRHGTPKSVDDLAQHRCINLRNWVTGNIMPWRFQRGDSVVAQDVAAKFTTNDGDSALQAVLSGAGIVQLSAYRIAPYVRSKRLTPVLLGHVSQQYSFYIYMQRRTQIPKKNRVLADFLFDELSVHPDLRRL